MYKFWVYKPIISASVTFPNVSYSDGNNQRFRQNAKRRMLRHYITDNDGKLCIEMHTAGKPWEILVLFYKPYLETAL